MVGARVFGSFCDYRLSRVCMLNRSNAGSSRAADPDLKNLPPSLQIGLSAERDGFQKMSPRLARRILRRWQYWAPILQVSLPAGTDLTTFQDEFSRSLIGLFRAGLSTAKIARLGLDDPRLSISDQQHLLSQVLLSQQVLNESTQNKTGSNA